jgi:signal peptidase II
VSEQSRPATQASGRWLRAGLWVAAATFLADQATKLWLLFGTDLRLTWPWAITPFFDLTVVWNRGISYGLFQQDGEAGRWFLTLFKLGAAMFLVWWLRTAANRPEALGLGLIIGGALGNALDRILHKAVFDFAHFHIGTFSWYVFNIADAAVVVGAGLLVVGHLFTRSDAVEKP